MRHLVLAIGLAWPVALSAQTAARVAYAARHATNVTAELLRLEQSYANAVIHADTTLLARIEPRDASFAYPDGSTGTGATDLEVVRHGLVHITTYVLDSLRVRTLGPTTAVVTGRAVVSGSGQASATSDSTDVTGNYRFTDVWQRRGGRWQLAASQYGTITPARDALRAREGDTLFVIRHRVKPANQAAYEHFMSTVWYPAAKDFGRKHPHYGAALERRWRLVPTEEADDGTLTYLFVYPPFGDDAKSVWDMFRQTGRAEQQVARDSTTMANLLLDAVGTTYVRREYPDAQ